MENNQITILLVLLAGIIFLLLVPSIPYTASQFFFQNTDLNYTKVLNGDYNNEYLYFDGNTISSKDINFPTPDINLSYADATFVPYVGAIKGVNLGLNDLNIGGNLRIDSTGTFDFSTLAGVPAKFGIYNPIPDDGVGGYNAVTYFTVSDPNFTATVGGLAFGGLIDGLNSEDFLGAAQATGLNGFINVANKAYVPSITLASLSAQVASESIVDVATGIDIGMLSTGTASISDAIGIKVGFNTADSGSIGNVYGLKLNDITAGSVNNYAWYSGLGKVHFGDDVEMAGSLTGVTDLSLVGNTLGAEKLINGTFTGSANNWVLGTGWTYNTNKVRKDVAGTGLLTQNDVNMVTNIIVGETYNLSFETSNQTVACILDINAGGVDIANTFFNDANNSFTFKAITSQPLTIQPSTNCRIYIDNISLKRYAGFGNNLFAGDTYSEKFIASQYAFQTQAITEASPSTKLSIGSTGDVNFNSGNVLVLGGYNKYFSIGTGALYNGFNFYGKQGYASAGDSFRVTTGDGNANSGQGGDIAFLNGRGYAGQPGGSYTWTGGVGGSGTAYNISGGLGGGMTFTGGAGASCTFNGDNGSVGGAITYVAGAGGNCADFNRTGGAFGEAGGAISFTSGKGADMARTDKNAYVNAGSSGNINYVIGLGGTVTTHATFSDVATGGQAGTFQLNGGSPGIGAGGGSNSTNLGTNIGGIGASISLQARRGGTASGGLINTGGAGGNFTTVLGIGGGVTCKAGSLCTGGSGGTASFGSASTGTGGAVTGAGTLNTGGNGALFSFIGGNGGASQDANRNKGGWGGSFSFTGGTGGSAVAGLGKDANAGNGGTVSFIGGNAGNVSGTGTKAGGNGASISFFTGVKSTGADINYPGTNGDIKFYTYTPTFAQNLTLMINGTSNFVGLNTATPSALLDVNGSAIVRSDFNLLGNVYVDNNLGLTYNNRVVKDVNLISSIVTYCDMNYIKGILVKSSC